MTAEELFDSTGDTYLSLVHPEIDSLVGSGDFAAFLQLADETEQAYIEELIQASDWRERIVGIAIAARKKSWHLARTVAETLTNPRGIAIVPAGAFLVTCGHVGKMPLGQLLPSSYDPDVFDGEVSFAIDCIQRSLSAGQLSFFSAKGPNYGQDIQWHTKLYVMLPDIVAAG